MKINNKVKQIADLAKKSRPGLVILAEIAAGIIFAVMSLWIFTKITDEVIERETAIFDNSIQSAIYSLRNPIATKIMATASFLGSKEFLFAISVILIIFFLAKNKKRTAITYTTILLLTAGLNNIIKLLIHRGRPDLLPLEKTSFYSFPSGHSMNSLVFYGLLAYFAYHYTRNKKVGIIVWIIALAIVVMIGFSRIYLGAHYPTDVIAGFVAGIFILASAIAIDKTLRLNRLLKNISPNIDK